MRVLVLENDRQTVRYIQEALRQVWCETDVWTEADLGLCALQQGNYDAVILGETLDDADGLSLLKRIRESGCRTPVLMLFGEEAGRRREYRAEGGLAERTATERSSRSADVLERIQALESGADYCLSMPVDGGELLAVLKALDRRRGDLLPERLSVGDLFLDQATFTLSGPAGSFQLGRKEFDVMRILMVNSGIVVSKDTLLMRVWGGRGEAIDNNVEVYISFLRKKLKALQVHVSIVTMRRLGYKLTTG